MSNEFPDQIWKVRKRSGMGLLHSRDVADLANYNRAERGWAACPVILESYGIVKIWRFRDDVLVLASERLKSQNLRAKHDQPEQVTSLPKKTRKAVMTKLSTLIVEVWIENGTIQTRPF